MKAVLWFNMSGTNWVYDYAIRSFIADDVCKKNEENDFKIMVIERLESFNFH